jgi:hypothetical protein
MALEQLLATDPRPGWFSLEQLCDALLAEAVSADARFQLTQAAAWQSFQVEFNRRGATLGSSDLGAGFGRQANLGLDRLSLELVLELYRPPWWRRCWDWLMRLFGYRMAVRPARYRLVVGRGGRALRLTLQATRSGAGRWQVEPPGAGAAL